MAKSKIKLTKAHFRTFITMDQLAEKMKVCRSAIDKAVKRFMEVNPYHQWHVKRVRTGRRGPATQTYRVTR